MSENPATAPASPTPAGLHDWYYWWSCYDHMHCELAAAASRRRSFTRIACRTGSESDTMWGRVRIHWRDSRRDPLHHDCHNRC